MFKIIFSYQEYVLYIVLNWLVDGFFESSENVFILDGFDNLVGHILLLTFLGGDEHTDLFEVNKQNERV